MKMDEIQPNQIVQLENGGWAEWLQFLPDTYPQKVITLQANENKRPQLIKDIMQIGFPNIMKLFIWKNQINSVEALCTMQFPHLRSLYLCTSACEEGCNQIRSIRDIRKAHWLSLDELDIRNNQICDQSSLIEAWFPKLNRFWAYSDFEGEEDRKEFIFPCFASKLDSRSMSVLGNRPKKFKIPSSIAEALCKKWDGLKIN